MIRKGYVNTSGGQCHYRYIKGRGTPIVFLHQTPSSSLMFEKLMYALEGMNAVPLILLDLVKALIPQMNP